MTGLDFETKFPICKEPTEEIPADPFSKGCALEKVRKHLIWLCLL